MRYLRLKKERRWKTCQMPSKMMPTVMAMENHLTRALVDSGVGVSFPK